MFDARLVSLSISFIGQTLIKLTLQEGDKIILTAISTDATQGTYAVVSNYGSLIIRILFLPLEESTRAFFSRLQKPASVSYVLETVLRSYVLLFALIASFWMYAKYVILLLAGPSWSHASFLFAPYLLTVPILGVNGILESYVQATATPRQVRTMTIVLCCAFMMYAVFVVTVKNIVGINTAIILGNAISMVVRAAWAWFETVKSGGKNVFIGHVVPTWKTVLWCGCVYTMNNVLEGDYQPNGGTWFIVKQCIKASVSAIIAVSGLAYFERSWIERVKQLKHLKEE